MLESKAIIKATSKSVLIVHHFTPLFGEGFAELFGVGSFGKEGHKVQS